jgi:hypothetical protein
MPHQKTIKIGALNIVIHPHSPQRYLDLFNQAFGLRERVKYRGDRYGLFGSLQAIDDRPPLEGIHGFLYRHLELDPDEPWLDLRRYKEAEATDLREINIPRHLKPEMSTSRYIFFPKHHVLIFETRSDEAKTLSHGSAQTIVKHLLNDRRLVETFGEVTVTVIPSRDSLERIFRIPQLRHLTIMVEKPNPDDLAQAEREVLGRLDRQKARQLHVELRAAKGKSLDPDGDTRMLARVASTNGMVEGEGRDGEGNPMREVTTYYPWEGQERYSPDVQAARDVFLEKAREDLSALVKRIRSDG